MDKKFKYWIILFKNKSKSKIMNKFKKYSDALLYYNNLLKENKHSVIFETQRINARSTIFELGLVERTSGKSIPIYKIDEFERNKKIEIGDGEYSFKKLEPFKIAEKIFDIQTNKRITVGELLSKYLSSKKLSMVSSLNNKLIIQPEDDIFIFSTKNINEAHRLMDILSLHLKENDKGNFLFIKDFDTAQRSYLYEVIEKRGYSRDWLYRASTTHKPRKSK